MLNQKLLMLIYYFVFITIAFFLSPFLVIQGIDQVTVGYFNSIAIIVLIIAFIIWGFVGDNIFKNKTIIIINILIAIIAFILLIWNPNQNILIISYFLIWGSFIAIAPIIDNLILNSTREKKYTEIRAWGSFGAAIGYFVNSTIMSNFNFETIFIVNTIFLIIMVVSILKIETKVKKSELKYLVGLKHVFAKPVILILLILTLLMYGVLGADDAYTYLYETIEVGLDGTVIGIVGFLSIIIEAIVIYKFPKIKVKVNKLLLIVAISLAFVFWLKFTGYKQPNLIILSDLLLGIFTGLFIPLSILVLSEQTNDKVKNTILSIYQITIKIGAAIIGLVTANYYNQTQNYHQIYFLHMLIVLLALIVIIGSWRQFNYKI